MFEAGPERIPRGIPQNQIRNTEKERLTVGYKNVTHRFLECDWCRTEEEYDEKQDAKYALPGWMIGRTHYKTSRGEAAVTLCPKCADIYTVCTQGTSTPRGVRFRAYMDTFFACENLITESTQAAMAAASDDDDDPFGMDD